MMSSHYKWLSMFRRDCQVAAPEAKSAVFYCICLAPAMTVVYVLVTELLTGCLVESANATPTAPQNRTAHCVLVSETTWTYHLFASQPIISCISDSPIPSPITSSSSVSPLCSSITPSFTPGLKPTWFTNPTPRSFTSSSWTAFTNFCPYRFFLANRLLFLVFP